MECLLVLGMLGVRARRDETVRNVVIADGCFANFRSVVMAACPPWKAFSDTVRVNFCQIAMEDVSLPIPQCGAGDCEGAIMVPSYHAFEVQQWSSFSVLRVSFSAPFLSRGCNCFTSGDGDDEMFSIQIQ
jgi:hypothetical protein